MDSVSSLSPIRRVLIVEDLPAVQQWLRGAVERAFPDATVDIASALAEARALLIPLPDMILLDLDLPDGDGAELLGHFQQGKRKPLCVVTTMYGDDQHLLPALRMGIEGYLLKERDQDEIAASLIRVAHGEPALSPEIAKRMLAAFVPTEPVEASVLTCREQQVLDQLGDGARIADIATTLSISYHTAASHVRSIYQKLGVNTRAAAAKAALKLHQNRDPK